MKEISNSAEVNTTACAAIWPECCTLHQSALFAELNAAQLETLAAAGTLLTPDSDDVSDGVVYAEGVPADALYLVRAGTIKMSQTKAGGEFVFNGLECRADAVTQ